VRIAVVNNGVPFIRGGAEHLAIALTHHLRLRGHSAVSIAVPFRWETPEAILESMFAAFSLRVPAVDRVIALKFPAYYVPHDDKVLWLLHQFRQVYDFWGTPFQDVPDTPEGQSLRSSIHAADTTVLSSQRIYTNSHVTSDRLSRFNGIPSTVLFPPLSDDSHFSCADYGDFIFYPSRFNAAKRQMLAIEAMRYVKSDVKLVVAGAVEAPLTDQQVFARISQWRLEDRVTFLSGFMDELEKARWFSEALACAYIPYDEDSYGYVTLEAYASRKAVVTASDSGGTSILVKHGQTGFIPEPSAQALAEAFDALYLDRRLAKTMGEAGHALVESLGITWNHVVATLTS
jgi:glycosyltransferase involved in cell wall biosynthesis